MHFAEKLRRFSTRIRSRQGAAPSGCLRKENEEEKESILKRRTLHRRRIVVCAARPVIARDFSDLDFRSSLFYRAYLLPLAFLYPFVPFIQRPFVSSPLRCLPIPPSLPFSRRVCPTSRLLVRESRRYVAVFLSVLFWRTSGGWHADKGNLLSQEISGGKGGGSRPRLGLFTCSQ